MATWDEVEAAINALADIVPDEDSGACPAKAEAITGAHRFVSMSRGRTAIPDEVDSTPWGTVVFHWDRAEAKRVEVYDRETFDVFNTRLNEDPRYTVHKLAD